MRILIITALSGIALFGQQLRTVRFSGILNDYSPANVSGGPWEIRGNWSVEISSTGAASFTADINMVTSDYGITSATQVDPNNPGTRSPHTHHIIVTGGTVSYDMSVCPAVSPATTSQGVVINGPSTTTGNGSSAAFESKGASTLQICIMGGSTVQYSNVSIVYNGPATTHFGPQPIHGVITKVSTQ